MQDIFVGTSTDSLRWLAIRAHVFASSARPGLLGNSISGSRWPLLMFPQRRGNVLMT